MVRTYDMTNRAQQAAQTTQRIAEATETLLTERPIVDVTLQSIAEDTSRLPQFVYEDTSRARAAHLCQSPQDLQQASVEHC